MKGSGGLLKGFNGAYAIDVSTIPVEPEALKKIPRALALANDILSLSSDGSQLTVAVPDENEPEIVEQIRFTTGMHVKAMHASRRDIRARLQRIYGVANAGITNTESPAAAAVNDILADALRVGASDVHLEPVSGQGGRVRRRVDGILQTTRMLDSDLHAHIISRIKLLAGMDIADKRQPQDGRYNVEITGRTFEARVSSMPTVGGEKLAIRLLADQASTPTLDQLNLPLEYVAQLRAASRAPHGFIVVAGPTGSGKTTTLYALMNQRNAVTENLCSIEDPVEVQLSGVSQAQVNPRAGLTFASALRAFLRQDPNVIMVGEMRDEETATVAAAASLSGQLVLTSLHSNDAPSAIERLVELGVQRRTIATGLTAVVAQRLVRRLCVHCAAPVALEKGTAAEFQIAEGTQVFDSMGCDACENTGYSGRIALFECLFISNALREAIAQGATTVELALSARRNGFTGMMSHGIQRAIAGQTSLGELRRVLAIGSE